MFIVLNEQQGLDHPEERPHPHPLRRNYAASGVRSSACNTDALGSSTSQPGTYDTSTY